MSTPQQMKDDTSTQGLTPLLFLAHLEVEYLCLVHETRECAFLRDRRD